MYFNRESTIDLKKSGLSIHEISKKTGISKTTVGRWLQEADKVIALHCPVCIISYVYFQSLTTVLIHSGLFFVTK